MNVTITGTVVAGKDIVRNTGAATDLAGQKFTLVLAIDDTQGQQSVFSSQAYCGAAAAGPCASEFTGSSSNVSQAALQIGANFYRFAGIPTASRTAPPGTSQTAFGLDDPAVGIVTLQLYPAAGSVLTTDYSWESPFSSSKLSPASGENASTGTFESTTADRVALGALAPASISVGAGAPPLPLPPSITPNGVTPIYSSSTTIQPGEWISIYGLNLAGSTATWNGDFPTSLADTSVTINGKPAYLWYVSPGQINAQAPEDTAIGATVPVTVRTAAGTATSTVKLANFAPSFSLLDSKHVAGIILRSDHSGAYGDGTYDIIGPTGTSLGYATTAARAGDTIALFGVGFGPTDEKVLAGHAFSGASRTTDPVMVFINKQSVTPTFAGLSSAGQYQINLTVPPGLGAGDVPLQAMAGGMETPSGVVISLQ